MAGKNLKYRYLVTDLGELVNLTHCSTKERRWWRQRASFRFQDYDRAYDFARDLRMGKTARAS